jgi:membrane-associated phospholipid phosphatase
MKHFHSIYKSMLLMATCFSFVLPSSAQSGEVKLLANINPGRPTSDLWKGVTNSVYPITVASPLGLLTAGYIQKDKQLQKEGWKAAGTVLINVVAVQGLKRTILRTRPYHGYPESINPYFIEKDSSFPSGHTSNAFAIATTLTLSSKKWYVAVPAYLWAAGAGYSRLYLGQHYPSDVLAGAAVGVGSAFVSRWLTEMIFKKKKRRVSESHPGSPGS